MNIPSDVVARLVTILGNLPYTASAPEDTIPYRFVIPLIARQLAMLPSLGELQTVVIRPQEAKTAKKELKELATHAMSLHDMISALSEESLRILNISELDFSIQLSASLIDYSNKLLVNVEVAKYSDTAPRGRPKQVAGVAIVLYMQDQYEHLTGRPATLSVREGKAGGEFLDFIAAIFEAMGIKESPEAAIRRAMEKKRGNGRAKGIN